MCVEVPLILASQSPRRRDLLQAAGYEFQVITPSEDAECGLCSQQTPAELVTTLAWRKSRDVARRIQVGWIIGCDTVAECQGQILGKPVNEDHAGQMLQLLSGREHRVYSGLCLWRQPENCHVVDVEITKLKMQPLTDQQINDYLDTGAWEGKAGGFGYQDGLPWLEILHGSASNVVGLPLELLDRLLKRQAGSESGSS